MDHAITCPVCGLEGVSPGRAACPQCDADLVCFRALDSFPDEPPVRSGHRETRRLITPTGLLAVACIVLLILLTVLPLYWFGRFERLVSDQQAAFIAYMDARPDGDGFRIYHVKEGDTLWGIAERIYGSGRYYPVLLEHNPRLGIYGVASGCRLRILADPVLAGAVYERIVHRNVRGATWTYTVLADDTLRSIGNKFYANDDPVERILESNPDIRLLPGQSISIRLE